MCRLPVSGLLALAWLCLGAGRPGAADTVLAPGEPLTPAVIADLVGAALAERGIAGRLAVTVETPASPLPNRAAAPMRIAITDLRYEARTGRYDARLTARLPTGQSGSVRSTGRAEELVDVAVLSRPVARGEIIGPEDVATKPFGITMLGADVLQRPEELVGMQAIRPLSAGRVLRVRDLAAPLLVRRGEPVTILFSRGGLEVTDAGVALDQGRLGETVRVQNTGSSEIRRAVVAGPRRVQVGMPGLAP
ncbi:flagellar basal body P-ring formation chaperone FlgA [Benzoatithermus flavus]|uniref:Flagella basal body P-ring formation protein FlgA n=1 Tax=Benzoatithermus flavus TaxID=3108223 RepID=A0ABU8XY90_9PROT